MMRNVVIVKDVNFKKGNMTKFQDAYGQSTTQDNPNRQMWYSVRCTYWTDNWSKLKTTGPGIPVCPVCGSPGYQSDYNQFDKSAKRYNDQAMEGYYIFLQEVKERCLGKSVQDAFKEWLNDGKRQMDMTINKLVTEESSGESNKDNR
jgi:hypothetical protein